MNKLMCRFVTTTKKKKIPDQNLDTVCPAGIPCKKWHAVVGPVKIGILCPHFFSKEMLKFWHAVLGPYSKVPMVTK